MVTVGCSNDDCIHNKNGYCDFEGHINVGDEYYNGCDEYLSYLNTPLYNELYFIAKADGKGLPRHRVEQYGRKIEYKGYTFYTQSYNSQDDIAQYVLTESRTGYHCGKLEELQKPEQWQKFTEMVKAVSNVRDLPLAVMQDGEYVIVEEADVNE